MFNSLIKRFNNFKTKINIAIISANKETTSNIDTLRNLAMSLEDSLYRFERIKSTISKVVYVQSSYINFEELLLSLQENISDIEHTLVSSNSWSCGIIEKRHWNTFITTKNGTCIDVVLSIELLAKLVFKYCDLFNASKEDVNKSILFNKSAFFQDSLIITLISLIELSILNNH